MKLLVLILAVVPFSNTFASALNSYTLLQDSAARNLYAVLTGPNVMSSGSEKKVVLDQNKGTSIICDRNSSLCTILNTDYNHLVSNDYEVMVELSGVEASALHLAAPEIKAGENHELGYWGNYGTGYIQFKGSDLRSTQATIFVTYCYQPGC